ncbi:MAG: cbb3-type cytochrome oxidase assembly protein CcoS [Cyclobacteriaceae bacterium]|nr:cbb3-type cytochrome oxidase assembly protein CcoS [Cyclobacteriaceae bacterium]
MSVIILLIIISIVVALGFLAIFIWAVKTGQFDDTVSPGIRILFDDKKHENPKTKPDGDNKPAS